METGLPILGARRCGVDMIQEENNHDIQSRRRNKVSSTFSGLMKIPRMVVHVVVVPAHSSRMPKRRGQIRL